MIVNCPECNGKVSSGVADCPHCGHPMKAPATEAAAAPPPSRGCAKGMAQLLVGLLILAGIILGASYFLWGKKPMETLQDISKGRTTLVDQTIDLGASSVGSYSFTGLPGGTTEVAVALEGRGEVNVRVIDDAECRRLKEAQKPLVGKDLKHHGAFALDDVKGTQKASGKLGAGVFHVVLENDNLLGGVRVKLTVVQDFTK